MGGTGSFFNISDFCSDANQKEKAILTNLQRKKNLKKNLKKRRRKLQRNQSAQLRIQITSRKVL
jgi:hypothetical protein